MLCSSQIAYILTGVPNLSFDALAIRMSYHHSRELHPNSRLSVGPEAWHSPISPWAFILHFKRQQQQHSLMSSPAMMIQDGRVPERAGLKGSPSYVYWGRITYRFEF